MRVPLPAASQLRCAAAVRGSRIPIWAYAAWVNDGAVVGDRSVGAHPVRAADVACRPAEDGGDPVFGEWWQVRVAVALRAAVVGVAEHGAAAVVVGVVEDVVDVPGHMVVGEQRAADPGPAGLDPGLGEVVRGREHAVGIAMDVGAAVAISVDAHRGEGGGHELHQALCAGGAGLVVAAVPGFFHADPGEQRPRNPVPVGRVPVQFLDPGRDRQRRIVQ